MWSADCQTSVWLICVCRPNGTRKWHGFIAVKKKMPLSFTIYIPYSSLAVIQNANCRYFNNMIGHCYPLGTLEVIFF
jgi:hypothetical protein